jgi:hypothetical protein
MKPSPLLRYTVKINPQADSIYLIRTAVTAIGFNPGRSLDRSPSVGPAGIAAGRIRASVGGTHICKLKVKT